MPSVKGGEVQGQNAEEVFVIKGENTWKHLNIMWYMCTCVSVSVQYVCVFLTLCTNSSILSMAWWACNSGVIPMKPSSLFLSSSSSSSSSFSSPSLLLSSSSFILRSSSHSGTLWQEKIETLLGVRDFRWLVDLCHLGHFVSFGKKKEILSEFYFLCSI